MQIGYCRVKLRHHAPVTLAICRPAIRTVVIDEIGRERLPDDVVIPLVDELVEMVANQRLGFVALVIAVIVIQS